MGVVFEGGCGSFELENEKLPSVAPVRDRRFHHGKKEAREFLREERGGGKGLNGLDLPSQEAVKSGWGISE